MKNIDWAMMTSANLSTQAWGAAPTVKSGGDIRICSYEIGIVVWPGLWDEDGEGAEMVPVFGAEEEDVIGGNGEGDETEEREKEGEGGERQRVRVEWRMPYDLPPVAYGEDEIPWSAEVPCREPDRWGRRWMGYGG